MNKEQKLLILEKAKKEIKKYINIGGWGEFFFFCVDIPDENWMNNEKVGKLTNLNILQACEELGGTYEIHRNGTVGAFKIPEGVEDTPLNYNTWKLEVCNRAIEITKLK